MKVQQLDPFKVQVTPEQSAILQEALFIRGGYWGKSGPVTQKTHQPLLKFRKGALSLVNHSEGGYSTWARMPHPEVSFDEALRRVAACEVPKTPGVTTVEISEEAPQTPGNITVDMREAYLIVAEAYDVSPDRILFTLD